MATQENALILVHEGQIQLGNEFMVRLGDIESDVRALKPITDTASYEAAMEVWGRGRREMKTIETLAEPERQRLQNALAELRDQRNKLIGKFEKAVGPTGEAAREWFLAERKAAADEQAKLNKGKTAENRVSVTPNIPAVAGTRIVPKYRSEVVNLSKVKREWMVPDIQAINAQARKDQDPAKTEKAVGGIKVHVE